MSNANNAIGRSSNIAGLCLITGTALAALTEAISGTVLSFARLDMMGNVGATSDEFARMDFGYTAVKLIAFVMAAWLAGRFTLKNSLLAATVTMTVASGLAAYTQDLQVLFAMRLLQGFSGGVILVSAQALLLKSFAKPHQALIQSVYAVAAVVAPATLVPYMHGWLLDAHSWTWIFLATVLIGLAALALLHFAPAEKEITPQPHEMNWYSLGLFMTAVSCLTYVLNQGNRWDWFEEPSILVLTIVGVVALVAIFAFEVFGDRERRLLDLSVFMNGGFSFGFLASFAAGFALLGSSYLIPSFAISVLRMTPTQAGELLLPSAAAFIATLFFTALIIKRGTSPAATIPLGILGLMLAMWMLSGSTSESGIPDMLPGVLVRGCALGFLFLSVTLITMLGLTGSNIVLGVALFNIGRQTGGLFGISFLQTFIEDQAAQNRAILAAHVTPGRPEVIDRLFGVTHYLSTHGLEYGSSKASALLIGKAVALQSTTIAFNAAFVSVALFFLLAAPVLVSSKFMIGKLITRRMRASSTSAPQFRHATSEE
ncbi:MFS transporter (plasmid) [Agrobacterium salinitolerans]|uniref:MFS transporter n=1 Tax=Agrobacterium salinitolerans TaxID=1183413 RepID=UPI001C23325F|nr:MFS transporter [Agrobacterium salinitolerans]QXC53033.1 MFS transporter [Agrobacterium salinitolerans]